jgi:tetratricopeptide (TPR) repeat protein
MLVCLLSLTAAAQSTFDARLSVHTIVREDIFAGWMANDMARLARGEKNLEVLLAERPQSKAPLLAWKASIALTRAAAAHEAGKKADFEREHRKAMELFDEAAKAGPTDFGVLAVTGGSYTQFADRLPEPQRATAWQVAYQAYRAMHEQQKAQADRLPLHLKGELLSGLALTAERTGRADEAGPLLTKIVEGMPGTVYATSAKRWIERPETRAKSSLACQTCHDAGTLSARTAALAAQK